MHPLEQVVPQAQRFDRLRQAALELFHQLVRLLPARLGPVCHPLAHLLLVFLRPVSCRPA